MQGASALAHCSKSPFHFDRQPLSDENPSLLGDDKHTGTSFRTHLRGRRENPVKEMKHRHPPLATQQNSCSFSWTGEILCNFTELFLVHHHVLHRDGLHFYTISYMGDQRTRSTAQATEGSTFPALCSSKRGRSTPFFLLFFNLTADFHCIPPLSRTVVIEPAQLGMYRNK